MSQIDQFESVFRSAVKELFQYRQIEIRTVLLVTDLDSEAARRFQPNVKTFLQQHAIAADCHFLLITGDEFDSTSDLLELIGQFSPDLICTYRNLHSKAWRYPHSLGEHLDVMLQKTDIPIMVLPHPEAGYQAGHAMQDTSDVMVVTDLHAINDRLINYAAAFTKPDGSLYLTHIEDERIFERYMEAISRIDVIDTAVARERLGKQLLKEPEEYFNSCAQILQPYYPQMQISSLVLFSQLVAEYRHQIESRKLDLLVLSAKDERQHAMRSVAYPLAVEIRQIPLLLL